jgi:hypothetical protein
VRSVPIVVNDLVLLTCVAMYFGTGWSLVLFSFPIRSRLTIHTYYDQFVPQVTLATRFFTWMTSLMIATSIVMLISEWEHYWWAPSAVLAGVVAATALTMAFILPLNKVMAARITDPAVLDTTLRRWMALNRVRVALWTVQWLAMATYFGIVLGR